MPFSAEEIDKRLSKSGKNFKKTQFFSFFTSQFLWEKLIFLKMPQAEHTKPYYFRKLHHKLCLKSLPWHGSACGILQKMTHQYARTVPSKITVASTNKLISQFSFFFFYKSSIATSQPWYLTKFGSPSWIKSLYQKLCIQNI